MLLNGSPSAPVTPSELAGCPLLCGLPGAVLDRLAATSSRRTYDAEEIVFAENAPSTSLHVVTAGRFQAVRREGIERFVLADLLPGESFGELGVLARRPRAATVIAVRAGETIEVPAEDVEAVLAGDRELTRNLLGTVAMLLNGAREDLARENWLLEARIQERTDDLRQSQLEIVHRLGQVAESRDPEIGRHITRMSRLCARLAEAAGMSPRDCETLLHAAPMHDIGKVAVPDSILHNPGPLSAAEAATMRRHTTVGGEILADSRSPVVRMAEQIALTHHERWDGSGYPRGLRGEDIPLAGRIAAVCDVFDALISPRSYKPAWTVDEALAELEREAGRKLDPHLVRLLVEMRPSGLLEEQ